jgi:hypothetical protein
MFPKVDPALYLLSIEARCAWLNPPPLLQQDRRSSVDGRSRWLDLGNGAVPSLSHGFVVRCPAVESGESLSGFFTRLGLGHLSVSDESWAV